MEGSFGPGKCPRDRRRTLAQSHFIGNARLPQALNNSVSGNLIGAEKRRIWAD
jgi:hypothetical protein